MGWDGMIDGVEQKRGEKVHFSFMFHCHHQTESVSQSVNTARNYHLVLWWW
jgi:hypothetical protein